MNAPSNAGSVAMISLANGSYTTANVTSGTSSASVAQGVAMVLVESASYVSDLTVTDSVGNVYVLQDFQQAGTSANGATLYGFTSNIEFPITGSTTFTITSQTAQQYGYLVYGSPYMLAGYDGLNMGSGNGNGTTLSAQFGTADSTSILYQVAACLNDGAFSMTNVTNTGITWYAIGSTSGQTAGSLRMEAYVMLNQGGGTGSANTGDTFTTTATSSNWAVLAIPLMAANQQDAVIMIDWKAGTTPGATTNWTNCANISANGMIVVVGQCGTGSGVTPSAMHDQGGNVYTMQYQVALPSAFGAIFVATAPVTAALGVNATGSISWGSASAVPNYTTTMYWLPNVSGVDATRYSVTGNSATGTGTQNYSPRSAGDLALSFIGNTTTAAQNYNAQAAPWNQINQGGQSYLHIGLYAGQITETATINSIPTWSASAPFAMVTMGFTQAVNGGGGGAAGGPNGPGYPATTWQSGAPAYAGGGKGGNGAANPNSPGIGAGLPGGGGGGGYSTAALQELGGTGGAGMLRVTYNPPLKVFNSLILHRPGHTAHQLLSPLVQIPITDIPNNTEYTVLPLATSNVANAAFNSTYTVMLCNYSWDTANAASSRQLTVTVNQYEYPGGPRSSVQATRAVTPATDIVNGLVNMGELTLPIKDLAFQNDQAYFTVSINDTDTNDRFMDVLFLDTQGQTVLVNIDPGMPGYGQYVNYFVDEPTADRDIGFIGASFQDRQHQTSVMDSTMISGGTLYITPGDNLLLAYSPEGAPNIAVRYAPRWYLDRTV
jgi:hypothetical protein